MKIAIIRADGTREETEFISSDPMGLIKKWIKADGIDTVNLRDGRVMIVDDTGMIDGKPENEEATKLVLTVYQNYPYSIHGDVAVATDADFA